MMPEIFVPGIVSTKENQEFASTFSPDGKEFFFTRRPIPNDDQQQRIWYMKEENGKWTEPALSPFSYDCFELEPFISPDGIRLYYGTTRPIPGSTNISEMPSTWVVEKTDTGWGTPKYFSPLMMFTGETSDRALYFTDLSMGGYIAVKRWDGIKYGASEKLEDNINYVKSPAHPFVAQDESYILYDGEIDNRREIYVSYKKSDGTWTKGVKFKEAINTEYGEMCPNVSPDGKYFFFQSRRAGTMDIYWVSSKIIEELKPKE
jgi:Tol biopolymer transport system component